VSEAAAKWEAAAQQRKAEVAALPSGEDFVLSALARDFSSSLSQLCGSLSAAQGE
jgi:hypothetical protein